MHRSKDHVNGMTRLAFCGGAIKDSRQEAAYFGMSIEGQKRRFSPSASLFRSAPTNGHRQAGPFGPVGAKGGRLARNVQGEQGLSVHQAGAGLLYDWIGPDAIDITMTLRVYDV